MTRVTSMALFYLAYFLVTIQAAPVHHLEGESLELAEQNGFLSDDYDKLHVIELSEYSSNGLNPLDKGRLRRRRESQETTKLNVPINGVNYSLSLQHPSSVLHPNAEIIVADGSKSEESHRLPTHNCHMVGDVDGHKGTASISYCGDIHGFIVVGDVEYVLAPLQDGKHLVAERKKPEGWPFDEYGEKRFFSGAESRAESSFHSNGFKSRSMQSLEEGSSGEPVEEIKESEPVVIEMAVYTDAEYTALLDRAKADTVQKKVDYLISKFNGVQYEYDKIDQLQRVVKYQIKKMVFFKTNPDWLNVTRFLGPMLNSLCKWNADKEPYDIVYMITGHSPISPVGLAWVGGACGKRTRCGVSMGVSWGRYVAIAHEIGHLLGMKHDYDTTCRKQPQEELGLMGGKGTDFSKCSVEDFHKSLEKPNKKCFFTQNIPDEDIMPELRGSQHLGNIPSVTNVTHHQYCEKLMGPGYRYREKEGMKYSCDRGYYCVQLKDGPDFGLIYQESAQGIVGMYCAPGKVCLKKQCLTYKLMTLHSDWVVRPGGWSSWSEWTPCSRSCGTGVKYSHRECDNPTPIQHKYCDGNEYKAELCNTEPCPGDPSDEDALIKSRADETCKRLVKANVLNPASKYKETGRVYGRRGYDNVCDVHCDNEEKEDSRDAILPDGTPCSSPDPEFDVGTRKNVHTLCFRGKCERFQIPLHTDSLPPTLTPPSTTPPPTTTTAQTTSTSTSTLSSSSPSSSINLLSYRFRYLCRAYSMIFLIIRVLD